MRLIRISAGLVAVAALLPVATAPASASAVQPKRTPVIVISSEGGFVAPGYIKSSLPSLVGYSNGAVLMRFDSAKRPDLREMRLRFVDPATLRALAAAIAKTAVVPAGGWGSPGVADVPNTRVQIGYSGLKRDVSVYALSFTNGGDVTPAQAKARRALTAAIDALDRAAKAKPAQAWTPATYEVWSNGTATQPSGVGMANPASVFCTSMGGTLSIVDEASGQVGYCYPLDGSRVEEWAYFRANAPAMGQWPAAVHLPSRECIPVYSKAFRAEWKRANVQGMWVMPTGQALSLTFRPVLPGEQACKRG